MLGAAASGSRKSSKNILGVDESVAAVYLGALALCSLVYQSFHDLGLSTLLTLSVGIQCFAYVCLRIKVWQQRSVAGISGRTLSLQAVSYMLRLCSTTWLKGYLPVDATGDWLYQLLDVVSLAMVMELLYRIFKTYRPTYQEDCDTFNVTFTSVACFVLAVIAHPDLNSRPFFDTLWATALYIDVIAMLPQLWMMSKIGGEVDALNCHFVGAIAISRMVNLLFWYHGFPELAPLDGSFNVAGWIIISAHVVQTLLLADFMWFYIKACTSSSKFRLPMSTTHDV